jgi:hypothetical protein
MLPPLAGVAVIGLSIGAPRESRVCAIATSRPS